MRMTRDDDTPSVVHQFEMDSSTVAQNLQQQQHQNGGVVGGVQSSGSNVSQLSNIAGFPGPNNNNNNNNKQQLSSSDLDQGQGNGGGASNGTTGGGGGSTAPNNQHQQQQQLQHQYTMPGVLYYIQHEFSRFEMERSQWDIDRAELQVSIDDDDDNCVTRNNPNCFTNNSGNHTLQ